MSLHWIDQLVDEALSAIENGDNVRALAILDQVAAERPYDATVRWLRSKILLSMGNIEEALTEARLSSRMEPSNADAHFLLACAAWQLDRYELASESFESAIRMAVRDLEITVTYARFLAAYDDHRRAEATAYRAIELDDGNPTAWAALAAAQHGLKQHSTAISNCRRALKLDPDNTYARLVMDDLAG